MCLDFLPESLAQADDVAIRFDIVQVFVCRTAAPDPEPVEEMEPPVIPELLVASVSFSTEVDCAREDSFKAVDESPIMWAIVGKIELLQDLGGGTEQHSPALLPNCKRRDPYGDQPILPEWEPVVGMSKHIEDESSIPSSVLQAATKRQADRQPAQDEGRELKASSWRIGLLGPRESRPLESAMMGGPNGEGEQVRKSVSIRDRAGESRV